MKQHSAGLSRPKLAACIVLLCGTNYVLAQPRPNILFLYADDLGYGDLGCYGHPRTKTPHLDKLASEGTRFTQFYVSHSVCSPTRTSALTGQYPSRWRMFAHLAQLKANASRGMPDWLDVNAPSMPRALQAAGYRTAHVGKWHLGGGSGSIKDGQLYINHPDAPPVASYGFDVVRATYGNAPTWRGTQPADKPHDVYPYDDREWQTYSSQAIADAAIEFLDDHAHDHREQPFLAHIWFKDPHTPMTPTKEMRQSYADLPEPAQTHSAMITFLDQQIGRLLAKLDELKLREGTLVLFSSDNGAAERRGGSNAPLRAYKWYLYEGGVRVPLIVRWPGHTPAGKVDEQSVLNICDFAPTFCRLAGASMPSDYTSDGIDITDALHGRPIQRPAPMMWHHPTAAKGSPTLAIRDGSWKLLMDPDGGRLELYDLGSDVSEQHNVAAEKPEITARLQAALRQWHASLPIIQPRQPSLQRISNNK